MTLDLFVQSLVIFAILIFTFLVSMNATRLIFFVDSTEKRIKIMKILAFDLALFLIAGSFYLHIAGT